MKPVGIFRFVEHEGPGYFADFLGAQDIPWTLIAIDEGEEVPHSFAEYSGLVFMGGPMSVNDDLPWIPPVLALIRDAVACDVPVLGHCLGGQLMSKALGGDVSRNPVKEIGWGEVSVADNEIAHAWFGGWRRFDAFHWHGETFSLPQRAAHLLSSMHCANQAWALGPHLALQCHVEMTPEMVASWCEVGLDEVATSASSPAVQSVERILQERAEKIPHLQRIGTQLYSRWIAALK